MDTKKISKDKRRLWSAPKPLKIEFLEKKDMAIYMSEAFYDEIVRSFPMTHISIINQYKSALKNPCFYRVSAYSVRIVGLGKASNQIIQMEFTCALGDDGDLYVTNATEGASSVGQWRSVKSDGRKK